MNAIQLLTRVQFYCDVTRNARYERYEIDTAVNDYMAMFIDQIVENMAADENRTISFQSEQVITDKLYTLQKTQTAAPTADVALYPADYFMLTSLFPTIAGASPYARPTTQNKLGPLLDEAFDPPSDTMPFYLQQTTGFKIYHGTGTITSVDLNYVKLPVTFTIGTDSQLINAGAGVLTNATSYIATEVSVHNGITYNVGTQFTSANTNLTSGQVILASNTVTCELPEKTHEEISKGAASLLLGVVTDFPKSQYTASIAKT